MKAKRIFHWIRTAWAMLGITFLLLLLLEIASALALRKMEARGGRRQELYWADSDSYESQPWIRQYTDDYFQMRLRWESYVYWRRRPFSSQYINVDAAGIRKTSTGLAPAPGQPAPRIFVFGGSTTWGEGARDEATVPSFLAQALVRRGVVGEVVNHGEGGYVFTQEVIALLRELQRGNVPDVAVFYNGLNDRYSAAQSGEAGIPQNEWNRHAEFNLSARKIQVYLLALAGPRTGLNTVRLLYRLAGNAEAGAGPALREGLARDVVEVYLANVRAVIGLGEVFGFTPVFYWQPTLYDKGTLTPFEQILKQTQPAHFEPFFADAQNLLNQATNHLETLHFHDIGSLLSEHQGPLYVDFSHLSEEGNRLIAERMAADIELAFRSEQGVDERRGR